ncbi:PepSY-associated TM helix domain-containing protein [Arcobacter vandammei]|uniref:PepSY-associated TM helix domain-containing protein n=1 Tax=Arcobacter vandammei TaxID=2782243 RepID=UPI0018DF6DBE|nr:PepSY-associated TM helix domain-containing protein [Arcobacter vandammei]
MHKSVWFQIHWFFGFVFGILLLLVGVSGAVLSYEKEILRAINKDTYFVQVPQNQERLSEAEILKIYVEKNPSEKINSIGFSTQKDTSVTLNIAKEGERKGLTIYLNPYTAEVLPDVVGKDFFMFFFSLHRWLAMDGDFRSIGKNAVALATIAAIILTIGGVIVYWGRIKNNFFKSFTFSFKHKNRAFLSTMHSALGMWVVPFFLLMCLTGLYWSYDWYRGAMYSVFGVEQPKREAPAQQPAQQNQQKQAQGERPQAGQGQQRAERPQGENRQNTPQVIVYEDIKQTVEIFNKNVARDYKNASLRLTPSKEGTYTISYLYADATHFRESNSMEIDFKNQKVTKEAKFEDKKLNEQIMSSILPLHSGEYFGWFGQLAYFISSALMALFVITGYMLYYDRWKKKRAKAQREKAIS